MGNFDHRAYRLSRRGRGRDAVNGQHCEWIREEDGEIFEAVYRISKDVKSFQSHLTQLARYRASVGEPTWREAYQSEIDVLRMCH